MARGTAESTPSQVDPGSGRATSSLIASPIVVAMCSGAAEQSEHSTWINQTGSGHIVGHHFDRGPVRVSTQAVHVRAFGSVGCLLRAVQRGGSKRVIGSAIDEHLRADRVTL